MRGGPVKKQARPALAPLEMRPKWPNWLSFHNRCASQEEECTLKARGRSTSAFAFFFLLTVWKVLNQLPNTGNSEKSTINY